MKRRSKENSKFWDTRVNKLFELDPKYKDVEQRYETLYILLQKTYPQIRESASRETVKQFIRDIVFLDRKIRWETEGLQVTKKKILSQDYQLNILGR